MIGKNVPQHRGQDWRLLLEKYKKKQESGARLGVMIIEEPRASYYHQAKSSIGMGANPQKVCPPRWKHMHCLHLVECPTADTPNMYIAEHLNTPHYMVSLEALESYLGCAYKSNCVVHWHEADPAGEPCDLPSSFVKFWSFKGMKSFEHEYRKVRTLVSNSLPKKPEVFLRQLGLKILAEESNDPFRKNRGKDSGFSSDFNLERNDQPHGIATPRKRTGTDDILMIAAMVLLSRLTGQRLPPGFLTKRGKRKGRRDALFCQSIHPDNIFEAFRAALSSAKDIVDAHEDSQNDGDKDYSFVPCLSFLVDLEGKKYRLSLIGYSRKSVRHCLDRRAKYGPLIDRIVGFYQNSDPNRREYLLELLNCVDGLPNRLLPHFDKAVHYSSFVTAITRLSHYLSPKQLIGVWAASVLSESPDFFWEYSQILLRHFEASAKVKKKSKRTTTAPVPDGDGDAHVIVLPDDDPETIAFKFSKYIFGQRELRRTKKKQKTKDTDCDMIGGARHQPHLSKPPTLDDCKRGVSLLAELQRELFLEDQHGQLDEHRFSLAIRILSHHEGVFGAGMMTAQHLMGIGGLSGLLPSSVLCFGEIAMSTKTAAYLHEKWQFSEESHTDDAMQVLSCLQSVLGISKMTAENLVCEWGRHERGRSLRYHDSIFPGQDIYRYDSTRNRVIRLTKSKDDVPVLLEEEMPTAVLPMTLGSVGFSPPSEYVGCVVSFWNRKALKTLNGLPKRRNRCRQTAVHDGIFLGKRSVAQDATPCVETACLGMHRKAVGLLTEAGNCLQGVKVADTNKFLFLRRSHISVEEWLSAEGDVYYIASFRFPKLDMDLGKEPWAVVAGDRIFAAHSTIVVGFLMGDSANLCSRIMPLQQKGWKGTRPTVRYFCSGKDAQEFLLWSVLLLSRVNGSWARDTLLPRTFQSDSFCADYSSDDEEYALAKFRKTFEGKSKPSTRSRRSRTGRKCRVVRGVPRGQILLISDAPKRWDRVSCVLYDWGNEFTFHKVDDVPGPENQGYTGHPLFISDLLLSK